MMMLQATLFFQTQLSVVERMNNKNELLNHIEHMTWRFFFCLMIWIEDEALEKMLGMVLNLRNYQLD